ncbi:hypothetical protein TNCT_447391 [Trichonephila clavata]|uniref:Uncharacterized protein n=1 Tax=Trichonephila clavata TaxID=2740835 RepID=A0A8X6G6T1_TRICU|nr:hypothetical protein TNCT_447391 [Trichonephila clavata]
MKLAKLFTTKTLPSIGSVSILPRDSLQATGNQLKHGDAPYPVRQFLFGTRESCWRYIGNPIRPGLVDAPVRCQPPNPRDAPLNARLMMPQLVIGVISLARYVDAA